MILEVGKHLEGCKKQYGEGCKFDITDSGCELITFFNRPSLKEIEQFKTGKLKFGYYTYKNVIMFLVKVGDLNWMDMPYSVHLSENLTGFQELGEGQGLSLVLYLVDAADGILKSMRLVGLNTRLTKGLIEAVNKQKEMEYDDYAKNVNYIYRTYRTKDLVNRAAMIENLRIIE